MNPLKRWRWWAVLALPLLVIAVNSFGPDGWREPVVKLIWLSWTALCVALAHSARQVDIYKEARFSDHAPLTIAYELAL